MNKQRLDDQVTFSLSKSIADSMLKNGAYTEDEYGLVMQFLAEKYQPYISQLLLDK